MSHSSRIFEEAPVKVQNRNGFDLSHLNVGTSKCGQLVPVMCKLLPPNTKFTLGVNMEVSIPPLASTFYGRIDAIVEGFVVPLSILYGGFKQFISNQQQTMFPSSQDAVVQNGGYALPYFDLLTVSYPDIADYTTLFISNDNIYEYLGVRQSVAVVGFSNSTKLSMLPGLAYHLIWDVWYRNKNVTKTIFAVNPTWPSSGPGSSGDRGAFNYKNVSLIWHSFFTSAPVQVSSYDQNAAADFSDTPSLTFSDGVSFFSTRQRCYARDYFTAASLDVQQGTASAVQFSVDTQGDGEFTIASLRAANALQKFCETNNLSGDFAESMRNRWGVKPIDSDFDEPYYLGRVVVPVYQKSIAQTGVTYDINGGSVIGGNNNNPFIGRGAIGASAGKGGFSGEGSIVDSFTSTTWSYVMCIFSLVPHAMYGYGLNRELQMLDLGDFPAPELQTIGYEAIKSSEVFFDQYAGNQDFAYIPRYSRFKYMDDEIHGEMRPGRTLDSFVLQRRLFLPSGTHATLTTDFLEIPQNALDSVFAVSTREMRLSCWYEIYFKFKVSMPLADFCIPTLGDIQDTHTIKAPIGGSRL